MTNPGIAPPVLSTDVGAFRAKIADMAYVALDPEVPGYGDYTSYSDEEIELYLEQGGDSFSRALGYYWLDLAGQAALQALSIADHDLKINQEARAKYLKEVSDSWFARADAEDDLAGVSDVFDSFEYDSSNYDDPFEGMPRTIEVY